MRYELTDHEWTAIKPMLPNKPRGVPRVNDRRVLNGIFWVLRSGAPWRDLPTAFGPYTTCYNRFVRWRRAGVWGRMIEALATAHDGSNFGQRLFGKPVQSTCLCIGLDLLVPYICLERLEPFGKGIQLFGAQGCYGSFDLFELSHELDSNIIEVAKLNS
ncbi:mll2531 [Mesorhizobium japonicum MAFF 303099]|uniref:Mll2531 protein n=1 Tax=Mesorhizobium japonicum (strain LMG 29417 / CECT 9101 / MAFF 303099) TaxID=266835 RepID=Q98I76_RHILO|nr:mll2531 [Mesorhizobium japonicum MAFF 303099]